MLGISNHSESTSSSIYEKQVVKFELELPPLNANEEIGQGTDFEAEPNATKIQQLKLTYNVASFWLLTKPH